MPKPPLASTEQNAETTTSEEMVSTTVELPRSLVARIDEDAKAGERKRATQIRWVLKQHYEALAS